ncbi:DUF4350 domain-containing protein [Rivularia sp. UHCC 0363]|uniref:DUF4350 domain-containing protein n=1 Tax=Rivularia sp. UHCC 0363 TaxID=3110244 RepID=UPI002B1FAFF0|nr:DUF4350 domain-containing protein [Rivularia sp. UHCC 0363]MEA5597285.1 DUF4350 domain-containing protein [Rivularia sp. UHCC 0363]
MKKPKRPILIGLIILGVIILITLIGAPTSNKIYAGSTYNRAPAGYGAWYAFMEQNSNIVRWRKPLKYLEEEKVTGTVLQINGNLQSLFIDDSLTEWVKAGNTLIILGVVQPVTNAEFTSMLESNAGNVKVETRRRHELNKNELTSLKDSFGAVVWQEQLGKGKVIYSTTPFIAANAYQDNLSNFKYLADLVKQDKNKIYVDEYIHGYKDPKVKESEAEGNLFSYLSKTALFPALIQLGFLILVVIWAQNRRFGKPINLNTRVIDNSEEYIQALAQVLEKADCNDFVVEMLGKEEQLKLQKSLSLGQQLLDKQTIINAWTEQIKTPTAQLNEVLSISNEKRRIGERQLLNWLKKWQSVQGEVEKSKNSSVVRS